MVVVDDEDLVRSGLSITINAQPDLAVIGEAKNGLEAVHVVQRLHPDVVLMDIRMPEMDGIAAAEAICGDPDLAESRVMIVTTFDDDDNIFGALKVGASGFIGKDAAPETLVQAIRTVRAGAGLVFPDATRALIATQFATHPGELDSTAPTRRTVDRLTGREFEVFELVARGMTNEEIGEALFIGNATVKTHINRCFSKLAVRDRAQMVVLAYEAGIVRPGEETHEPNQH